MSRSDASQARQPVRPRSPGEKISVFISYARPNRDFAEKLRASLLESVDSVFLDKYSIDAGESIPGRITSAIGSVQFFLCVLSPAALASDWVNAEWESALHQALSSRSPIIVPLLLEQCEIPALLAHIKYIDCTSSSNYEAGLAQLQDVLGLNLIGDDSRFLDETFFHMSRTERQRLYEKIRIERKAFLNRSARRDRCMQALDDYSRRGYRADFREPGFNDARQLSHYVATMLGSHQRFRRARQGTQPFVVSICGFPGLGKTTFARELRLTLTRSFNLSCSVLEFEKWMKDRSARWRGNQNLYSGFDQRAFHYGELVQAAHELFSGNSISVPIRERGDRKSRIETESGDVLIFDGVLSFFDEFNEMSNFNIFFEADLATKFFLSAAKDHFVRRYDIRRVESKFTQHDSRYPTTLQVLRNRADLIVICNPFHKYRYFSSEPAPSPRKRHTR